LLFRNISGHRKKQAEDYVRRMALTQIEQMQRTDGSGARELDVPLCSRNDGAY
jgi:hypothetical protein